jgi:hypothetical protein
VFNNYFERIKGLLWFDQEMAGVGVENRAAGSRLAPGAPRSSFVAEGCIGVKLELHFDVAGKREGRTVTNAEDSWTNIVGEHE